MSFYCLIIILFCSKSISKKSVGTNNLEVSNCNIDSEGSVDT